MKQYKITKPGGEVVFTEYTKEAGSEINREATALAKKIALVIIMHIRRKMAEPKSGRVYSHPTRKGTYTASAPGEYPADRRGAKNPKQWLSMSLKVSVLRTGDVRFGSTVEHALKLELTSTKALRPFFRRARNEMQNEIDKLVKAPWSVRIAVSGGTP